MSAAALAPRGARVWLLAARPATLPAAVVPVIVGTAAALHGAQSPRLAPLGAALVCSLLIQVGTNFANDVFDFRRGADTAERLGPLRVTQSGLVSPRKVLLATYVTFGLAALVGLYLVFVGGPLILAIGVLSILAGLAYTGGPWPIGYHGLGDLFVFIFFGLFAVLGSAYLQTETITPLEIGSAVPTGLLVTAILIVNNLRDLDTDREVGKRTLAVRVGRRNTRLEYTACLVIAYIVPPVLFAFHLVGPLFWLPWLCIPVGLWLVRYVWETDGRGLNVALKRTGQLHLLFGVLFATSLWL